MLRFNIDFSSDELSNKIGQRVKEQIAEKLASAGLAGRVKVTFAENGHGVPIDFELEGLPDDLTKANEVLRLLPDSSADTCEKI